MVEERKDKSLGGELKKVAFVMDQKNHTVQWAGTYADVFIKQWPVCMECNIHEEKSWKISW